MSDNLLPGLNLLVCLAAIWVCICRAMHMSAKTTKAAIRAQYIGWAVVLFASALSPLFGQRVNVMQFSMACWVLAHMAMGVGAWRHGPPAYTLHPRVVDSDGKRFVDRRFHRVI